MMKSTLEQLRAEIDRLDEQILPLLNRRAALAVEIGAIKQANGSALYVPARERDVLHRQVARNEGPLSHRSICRIYAEIMRSSLAVEHKVLVITVGAGEKELREAVRFMIGGHTEVLVASGIEELTGAFAEHPEALLVASDAWLDGNASGISGLEAEWRGAWRMPSDEGRGCFHLLAHPETSTVERPATVYCLVEAPGFSGGTPPSWVREIPAVSMEYAVASAGESCGMLQLRMEMTARDVREKWAGWLTGHSRSVWIVS